MARLCLVEDDPTIRELIAQKLARVNYSVQTFPEAAPLLQDGQSLSNTDLFIVDLMLPGEINGFELCQQIRERSPWVPVLILSALSEPQNRIDGLKAGADDYLTKPFEMEELMLRVQGMLRRRTWYQTAPTSGNEFSWGSNRVHFQRLEGSRDGKLFSLSPKECMLLKLLIERSGEVVSRDEILDKVWGYHVFPSTRTVDNFIVRLRKCFEKDPANPVHIQSVRGYGYRFTHSESA